MTSNEPPDQSDALTKGTEVVLDCIKVFLPIFSSSQPSFSPSTTIIVLV